MRATSFDFHQHVIGPITNSSLLHICFIISSQTLPIIIFLLVSFFTRE